MRQSRLVEQVTTVQDWVIRLRIICQNPNYVLEILILPSKPPEFHEKPKYEGQIPMPGRLRVLT